MFDVKSEKTPQEQTTFFRLYLEFLRLHFLQQSKSFACKQKKHFGCSQGFFSLFISKIIDVENSAVNQIQFSNKILLFMRLCKGSFQIQSRVKLLLFRSKMIEIQLRKQKGKPITYCTLITVVLWHVYVCNMGGILKGNRASSFPFDL